MLKINDFEGGGVAVGLSCPHMLGDATCATLFFKSWTEVLRRREPLEHPPSFNPLALRGRSVPNIHTKSAKYYATKSEVQTSSVQMATATFKFSNSVIKQCLSEVHEDCPDTPFDLLAALFWTRITRLKDSKNDYAHSLSFCTDCRRLLQVPLPYGHFGNALHFSVLRLKGEEMGQVSLGHVVQLVHSHLLGMEEEEFWSVMDWFEAQKGGEEGSLHHPLGYMALS
ncbi:Rosmarinate synthase [Morella rubra]|uniref:Rosmarinate synthase n=1 Tax=Morella rubra TaxID=262757 RepID=A0A6A1V7Y6_9ROSI|nr:Rosmarinate synthase [Morella rubra]